MAIATQLLLFKLGIMFQDNQYLSIHTITKTLGVSTETAYRYIKQLQRDYNAPICNDHMNRVFHLTKRWDMLGELNRKLRSHT